jgi:hypothetical protein
MTKEDQKPIDAAGVRSCIQSHFGVGGEKYSVLFEVRNGTAWRANRSVDAVVMGLWPSLGMELWGMEIKTARYDWLREMKDPGKASEVFGYFDRWFLVAPADIIKPDEIPQPWGWLVPENGRLRQAREASKNDQVKAVDRHFLGALLRRTAKTDDAFIEAALNKALQEQRRQFDTEIDKRALERQGDLRKDAEQWAQMRELLKQKPDDWVYQADVIEAVRLLLKAGVTGAWGGLRSLVAEVDRVQASLDKVADELGIDPRPKPKRKAA